MPSQPPLPPLLIPYLFPPSSSLVTLTSTLGASTNWLILRFLYSALLPRKRLETHDDVGSSSHSESRNLHVVFASWLNDFPFWRDAAKRLGLDLAQAGRLTFIDALITPLGLRERGIEGLERTILSSITKAKEDGADVLLVMDGLDLLLAATETTVEEILGMISVLREEVQVSLLTFSADAPLIHECHTPLEIDHVLLIMSVAHQARCIFTVRELDTGVAKDVSGVLRVGRGGGEGAEEVERKEMLYFVANDGGVNIFERGA